MPAKRTERTVRHYTPSGGVTQARGSYTDFMCVCTPEAKAATEACVARVCEALSTKRRKLTLDGLVSAVVYSITWGLPNDCTGYVDGIPCDQWCGVTGGMKDGGGNEVATFFVQCDEVEHGFARLYELMNEAAAERESVDG